MADQQNPFAHLNTPAQPAQPAQPQPANRGVVIRNPAARQEERSEEELAMERERLRLSQSSEGRAAESEERAGRTEVRDTANSLRKEFRGLPVVVAYEQALPNFVAALGTQPTGTGDLALVYYFAKAIDPGSAVQQGEMENIQTTDARLPAAVQTALRELRASDGRFTEAAREGLRRELLGVISQRNLAYRSARDQYRQLASSPEYGVDPNLVIGEHIGTRYLPQINQYFDSRREPAAEAQAQDRALSASGLGETFMTPEDRELQSRMQAAWPTATLEQLQAIAAEYGRTIPLSSQQELDEARRQGRGIVADPTGRRTGVQRVLGEAVETPAGAYFIGASNALLSGGLDEIAGAMGLDAEAIQAGKEALRQRYPASSFAGEVTGQVLQAIPMVRGATAVGLGARGIAGAEIVQGAAYGAGESNEDRLTGAGVGALGTLAGQQVASRFIEPGVRAVIDRLVGQTGAPREVIEQLVDEALPAGPASSPSVGPAPTAAGQAMPSPAAGAAPTPTAPPVAPAATPSVAAEQGISEDLIRLARASTGRRPSARAAREELRAAVQADPTIVQQAERLGLELPADVFSANVQLRNLAGLARSQPGSEAQTAWQQTLADSAQKVETGLTELGASRDLAGLSDQVFTRLNNDMEALARQGNDLRESVNANLNLESRVEANNLASVIGETIAELGGPAEARQAMTTQERMLMDALGIGSDTPKQPTYAYLDRLRRDIGRALERRDGPWADTDEATLNRYYAALAQDRVAHVERELGREAADQLARSNEVFTSMYAARREMTDLFGRDLDRGIGAAIRGSVAQGGRGDASGVRRLMAAVPEDMRNEVAFSGILANARQRGGEGGFSFANFRNTYRAIRENGPVYQELAKNMSPQQREFLEDLYAVSRRIADGESRIERTGRALSPVAREINAQSLTQRIIDQATTRGVGAMVGGVGGTAMGDITLGVPLAVGMEAGLAALSRGSASNLDRVNSLIGSAPYREVVDAAASGADPTRAINRLANSRAFANFTRGMGLNTQDARRAWIRSALTSGAVGAVNAEPAQSGPQPIAVQAQ